MQCITSIMQGLSREHACIEIKGDSVFIYDKVSRNRTRRNKVGLLHTLVYTPTFKSIYSSIYIPFSNLKKIILKIFLTFTNSVDPVEMQYYTAFFLGLLCLQKYLFRGLPNAKG